MKNSLALIAPFIAAALLAACSRSTETPTPPQSPARAVDSAASAATGLPQDEPSHGAIPWRKGDVDTAFADARVQRLPVFLYWGAVWCPPCNQVKATIFNRQDFIERARFFIPVYLDGDSRSAQKLGARFNVSGYPTMILFTPDGREITRLPGEVDADQYMRVLALGMGGARPVKETLATALSPTTGRKLSADDWRLLAYYSWEVDEQQLVPKRELPATLRRLAQTCPADHSDSATRLELHALSAAARAKGAKPAPDAAAVARMTSVVNDARLARENFDTLTEFPAESTGFITASGSPERAKLVAVWTASLDRLANDESLSTADRLAAIIGEVQLAKLDTPGALPKPLLDKVRTECGRRADRGRTARRIRRAAQGGAQALAFALLLHGRSRGEREEARRQVRGARLVRTVLCRRRRTGYTAAVGRALRQRVDRFGAAGRGAHRADSQERDRRARANFRHVLRAQPARARADGDKALGVGQGPGACRHVRTYSGRALERVCEAAVWRSCAREVQRRAAPARDG